MKDFEILFAEGHFVGGRLVTAKVWRIDPKKYPRRAYERDALKIGFAMGVKIEKSAVKRNRAKRQMREVVRLLLKEDLLNTGFLVAILGKKEIIGAVQTDIQQDLSTVLRRAGLMRGTKDWKIRKEN